MAGQIPINLLYVVTDKAKKRLSFDISHFVICAL